MKAFTLIELLVVIGIFSIIAGSISSIFISGILSQKRILETQVALDEISFFLEYLTRKLKMVQIDLNGDCIPQKTNYCIFEENQCQNKNEGSGIAFLDQEKKCTKIYFKEGKIFEETLDYTLPLNSLSLEKFTFAIFGEKSYPEDTNQPKVTISFEISIKGKKYKFQTTICQRNLDVGG